MDSLRLQQTFRIVVGYGRTSQALSEVIKQRKKDYDLVMVVFGQGPSTKVSYNREKRQRLLSRHYINQMCQHYQPTIMFSSIS